LRRILVNIFQWLFAIFITGLLEYFLKYLGLQTLALLSLDSAHKLI